MSILDSVGSTPRVSLDRINPNPGVRLHVKLEGANPGGSVKDRIAHYMIKDAEGSPLFKSCELFAMTAVITLKDINLPRFKLEKDD